MKTYNFMKCWSKINKRNFQNRWHIDKVEMHCVSLLCCTVRRETSWLYWIMVSWYLLGRVSNNEIVDRLSAGAYVNYVRGSDTLSSYRHHLYTHTFFYCLIIAMLPILIISSDMIPLEESILLVLCMNIPPSLQIIFNVLFRCNTSKSKFNA